MSQLQFTVFSNAGAVATGDVVQENVISIGGTSAQGEPIQNITGGQTNRRMRVRIAVDDDCWVTWGANPTALTNGTEGRMMGATGPSSCEYFDIRAGDRIAVIQRT